MEKLNNPSEFSLILKYALKDLSRNYHKISSIIVTLFISLFILKEKEAMGRIIPSIIIVLGVTILYFEIT